MVKRITAPLSAEEIKTLNEGDIVYIDGIIYTARDQAHIRLAELIDKNLPLPIPLENQIIYYAGPTPVRPGEVIGACGPTT